MGAGCQLELLAMLKDQFNPFMRETLPPLLLDASADSHVTWGWCVLVPCVTVIAL